MVEIFSFLASIFIKMLQKTTEMGILGYTQPDLCICLKMLVTTDLVHCQILFGSFSACSMFCHASLTFLYSQLSLNTLKGSWVVKALSMTKG